VSGERSEIALVVQRARITHAKSVATLPDGEVDDIDHLGRTLDQAIADAVLATIATLTATLTAELAAERAEVERLRAAGDALAEVADEWPELVAAWQEVRRDR
jgi:hypothetical protein